MIWVTLINKFKIKAILCTTGRRFEGFRKLTTVGFYSN